MIQKPSMAVLKSESSRTYPIMLRRRSFGARVERWPYVFLLHYRSLHTVRAAFRLANCIL